MIYRFNFFKKNLKKILYCFSFFLSFSNWYLKKNVFIYFGNSEQELKIFEDFFFSLDLNIAKEDRKKIFCQDVLERATIEEYLFNKKIKKNKKIFFSRLIGKKGQVLKKIEKINFVQIFILKNKIFIFGQYANILQTNSIIEKIQHGRAYKTIFKK